MFETIYQDLEETRIEMKSRLKQSYISNYRTVIKGRSERFYDQLQDFQKNAEECIKDFERFYRKGEYFSVTFQKEAAEAFEEGLQEVEEAFSKMCEDKKVYKGEI